MAKHKKTTAMRLVETKKIDYIFHEYNTEDGHIDGVSVATKMNQDIDHVFKTLVTISLASKNLYIFVIPVAKELDLKKAAKSVSEKKLEMIPVKDITKHTGYIRGGCSPIGVKKHYQTLIDDSAKDLDYFIFSGGKIGLQIQANPIAIAEAFDFSFADLTL